MGKVARRVWRLKQDLVIPAGTFFYDAPTSTTRSAGHAEHIIGLTKNTTGSLVYYVGDKDRCEARELADWFEEVF